LGELLAGATLPPGWESPVRHGEALCAPAAPDLPLGGLRVLRPGLALARTAGARLEPHHHLAMALAPGAAARRRALDPESARAYLAGAALAAGDGRGPTWVHLDGLPLGWAREAGLRANNLYPRALRRTELVAAW
jgi:NOL1/NOP2/fmu family ribosome biogenesis protein